MRPKNLAAARRLRGSLVGWKQGNIGGEWRDGRRVLAAAEVELAGSRVRFRRELVRHSEREDAQAARWNPPFYAYLYLPQRIIDVGDDRQAEMFVRTAGGKGGVQLDRRGAQVRIKGGPVKLYCGAGVFEAKNAELARRLDAIEVFVRRGPLHRSDSFNLWRDTYGRSPIKPASIWTEMLADLRSDKTPIKRRYDIEREYRWDVQDEY